MIVKDKVVLARFRLPGPCEYCGRPCPNGRDPHHAVIKRGMGGGRRLDVPENLISLCRGFYQGKWVSCHDDAERGVIPKADLLAIIARRENMLQDEIEAYLWLLLRRPKCVVVREEPEEGDAA